MKNSVRFLCLLLVLSFVAAYGSALAAEPTVYYVIGTSERYHATRSCSSLSRTPDSNIVACLLSEAPYDLTPCQICDPPSRTVITNTQANDPTPVPTVAIVVTQAPVEQPQEAPTINLKSKATIIAVQERLNELGYECGKADGKIGKATKKALKDYQTENALSATGKLTAETYITMFTVTATPPAEQTPTPTSAPFEVVPTPTQSEMPVATSVPDASTGSLVLKPLF